MVMVMMMIDISMGGPSRNILNNLIQFFSEDHPLTGPEITTPSLAHATDLLLLVLCLGTIIT